MGVGASLYRGGIDQNIEAAEHRNNFGDRSCDGFFGGDINDGGAQPFRVAAVIRRCGGGC